MSPSVAPIDRFSNVRPAFCCFVNGPGLERSVICGSKSGPTGSLKYLVQVDYL